MIHADLATWAWVLVATAVVNVVLLGLAAAILLWRYYRRYRPLTQLAEAVASGDLDKARFLLEAVRGPEGRAMAALCRTPLLSSSPDQARERFVRAYVATYPSAPLGMKLCTTALCGTAALLPFFLAAAGRADAMATALEMGAATPTAALTLYRLGIAETVATGVMAWAIILMAYRADPGAPAVRRRIVGGMVPDPPPKRGQA